MDMNSADTSTDTASTGCDDTTGTSEMAGTDVTTGSADTTEPDCCVEFVHNPVNHGATTGTCSDLPVSQQAVCCVGNPVMLVTNSFCSQFDGTNTEDLFDPNTSSCDMNNLANCLDVAIASSSPSPEAEP